MNKFRPPHSPLLNYTFLQGTSVIFNNCSMERVQGSLDLSYHAHREVARYCAKHQWPKYIWGYLPNYQEEANDVGKLRQKRGQANVFSKW